MAAYVNILIFILMFLLGTIPKVYGEDWLYSVRSGDTLWALCEKYTHDKNCWKKIGPYNKVAYPKSMAPGTRIKFPLLWLKRTPEPVAVTYVKGSVWVKSSSTSEFYPVDKQKNYGIGAVIRTEKQSYITLKFADGSVMSLDENSEVVLDTLSNFKDSGMVDARIRLLKGSTQVRVPKRTPRSNFHVITPSAIAAVTGTQFRVSASQDLSVAFMTSEVYRGAVDVNAKGARVSLQKNFGVKTIKGQPPSAPTKLLPAAEWVSNTESLEVPYTLKWKALEDATGYKIEILNDENRDNIVLTQVIKENIFAVPNLHVGCYHARVIAIDTLGLQGQPSQRRFCLKKELASPSVNLNKKGVLHWSAINGAQRYDIQISTSPEFTDNVERVSTDLVTYKHPVNSGVKYYVRVRMVDGNGEKSAFSHVVTVERASSDSHVVTVERASSEFTVLSILLMMLLIAL